MSIKNIPIDETDKLAPKVNSSKEIIAKLKSVSGVKSIYTGVVEINMESGYQKTKFQRYVAYSHDNEYDDYNGYSCDCSAEQDNHDLEENDDIIEV